MILRVDCGKFALVKKANASPVSMMPSFFVSASMNKLSYFSQSFSVKCGIIGALGTAIPSNCGYPFLFNETC